jgi:molybdate transport system substrate-binding protein
VKRRFSTVAIGLVFLTSCALTSCATRQPSGELTVAAAANLQRVLDPLAEEFGHKTRVKLVSSLGSSSQLEQQIENGAPFDVFLSADTEQVDRLAAKGLVAADSRAVYARGVLVLWAPKRPDIRQLEDLGGAGVKRIGIANPELAPYGKAAIESLTSLHLWPQLEPKVIYGPNISVVAQFAESANADASFTALALVNNRADRPIPVPENLHQPIDQALCIVKSSPHLAVAAQFRGFILSSEGQAILERFGYRKPG